MSTHTERRPFLLEIGSEEIPARFTPTAMREIETRLSSLLAQEHLEHGDLRVLATPRRLVVLCDGLAAGQPDREEEVKGPPVKVAFDADGNPTKAGEGFARKVGLPLDECGRGQDQRGEHLLVRRTVPGRAAAEVLAEHLPQLILGLPFRKTMRWGDLDLEYARPLQWLLCLHGEDVVPFEVGPLVSGRTTRGHRTLSGDEHRDLAAVADYLPAMADLGIMPDPAERRRTILEQAEAVLSSQEPPAVLRQDPELLDEVVHLCEFPTAFVGAYGEESFELPEEVIVTALKAHQRYFAVDAPEGGLRPAFLAVRDGGRDHLDTVRAGNERVLRARLADALFYWRFDQQKSPEEHAANLAQVTWLEGYGSVADQTRRAAALVEYLWQNGLGEGELPPDLGRAAALSRFDLVTEMIKDGKEFTKLEGVIASRYAAAAGEPEGVCRILEQCQRPASATGILPDSRQAKVLSAAWRLDTLAGCWLAGFAPTGAKDAYALRRHTLAIIRIAQDLDARLDLSAAVGRALEPYRDLAGDRNLEDVKAEILEFVAVRLAGYLQDACDADPDVVRAVLPVRGHDPADALAWVEALSGFRGRDDFLLLARGFKRCSNILKGDTLPVEARAAAAERWRAGGAGRGGEDFAGLQETAEIELRDGVVEAVPELLAHEAAGDYVAVFQTLSALGPRIDRFFDDVRVNTDDPELTALRRAFLREIHALFMRYADVSQVAPDED